MAKYLPDLRAGDTYRLKLQYPVGTDLTGYRHWLTLRSQFGGEIALEVDSVFGAHTADDLGAPAAVGPPAVAAIPPVAYLEATPAQTALVTSGKYYYDVQAAAPNGDVVTIVPPVEDYKDRLFVAPQVTEEP